MKLNFSKLICVALLSTLSLLGQTSHLSNLSVLNQSGTGSNALTAGFTIGSGPAKQVLIRAIGPSLSTYGVNGVMADPSITIFDSAGNAIATNDNWDPSLANTFNQVGAFPLPNGSKDAAVIATLTQGNYTARVTGMGSSPTGNVIIELYEVTANGTQLVNLSALTQVGGTGSSTVTAGLSVAQGIGSRLLLIRAVGPTLTTYGVPNVISNPQLQLYSGSNVIAQNDDWGTPVGLFAASSANLASAFTQSGAFALPTGSKDAAILVNLPSGNYTIQVTGVNSATGTALIEAYDLTNNSQQTLASPNSPLYYTQLRPTTTAISSTGSGYASITFDSNGNAIINVNLSNLSSGQTNAYLRLVGTNDYLLALPTGQISQQTWKISPIGIYSANDIINALNNGQIYISISTANYPNGELSGIISPTKGSQIFSAPTPPPNLPSNTLINPTDIDSVRLLTQATFGPTDESIIDVKKLGVTGWIQAQIALPPTLLYQSMRDDVAIFPSPRYTPQGGEINNLNPTNRNILWWKNVCTAPDQLRQRVAFALSEIFVTNDPNSNSSEFAANYYDILVKGAFGNFRDLIENITLNPWMGNYLTYLRNQKADPVKGTSPDENYAREIQQLFTVGLVQLQPDGSLLLDTQGLPIPTYDNITITETAKVFTGWSYNNDSKNFFSDPYRETYPVLASNSYYLEPMISYPAYHDTTSKAIISTQQVAPRIAKAPIIPANQTPENDLKIVLDTLFNHPNTGPFICKQLIQKLVTSNPSPGYVYRVSQIFANNGKGVRGDLGSVIQAILTDYEARSTDVINNVGYGKIKEPLVRMTSIWRVMKTSAPNGRFLDSYYYDPRGNGWNPVCQWQFGFADTLSECALEAPSVFNFYSPFYTTPGTLSNAGLLAPEMQITDASFSVKVPNFISSLVTKVPPYIPTAPTPSPFLENNFSSLLPYSSNSSDLIDRVNLLLCEGQMSASTKALLSQYISAIPTISTLTNYSPTPTSAIATGLVGLSAPTTSNFTFTGPFTLEAWIFPYLTKQYGVVAGKCGTGWSDQTSLFSLYVSNTVTFNVSNAVTSKNTSVYSLQPASIGKWTHIAGTYDGTTLKLYINGVLNSQASMTSGPLQLTSAPFCIGQGIFSNGQTQYNSNFDGAISQVRFWSIARTADQIKQGMNEGIPSDKTGLIGGWLLNEGTGAIANDYSGNSNSLHANSTQIEWAKMDGTSAERVRTALYITTTLTDSAFQK